MPSARPPTAADRSPHVPRRHAARHNHRGSRHRPGYDQIQPPTAASNDQIQAGDLSAAPQSRAWTADNTGLPELQRSRSYCVAAVSDIWLGCLAPTQVRAQGNGRLASRCPSGECLQSDALDALDRPDAVEGDRLAPSAGSRHGGRSEVCHEGPMSLRHQRLMARSTTWSWVPTVNGSRLSTSHPASWNIASRWVPMLVIPTL